MNKILMTRLLLCLLPFLLLVSGAARADERAVFLQKAYLSFCMKHFNDYGTLRSELIKQQLPKLPPQQAGHFLQGNQGDAWPLPYQGQFGQYVLALREGDSHCAVLARHGDAVATRRWFGELASTAPAPLQATRLDDRKAQVALMGDSRVQSWQWSTEHAPRRLMLNLTTADDPKAAIQAMVSLSLDAR